MYSCEAKALTSASNRATGEFFIKLPAKLAQCLEVKEDGTVDPLSLAELMIDVVLDVTQQEVDFAAYQTMMASIFDKSHAVEPPKRPIVKQKL